MDAAYGALLLNLIKQMAKQKILNVDSFPSLETLFHSAYGVGLMMQMMGGGQHISPCLEFGKKYFGNKSEEQKVLEAARLKEYKETTKKGKKKGGGIRVYNAEGELLKDEEMKDAEKKEWFATTNTRGFYLNQGFNITNLTTVRSSCHVCFCVGADRILDLERLSLCG